MTTENIVLKSHPDPAKAAKIKANPNTRLVAVSNSSDKTFDVFMDVSGARRYLSTHKRSPYLYDLFKDDGITLTELKRWAPKAGRSSNRKHTKKFVSSVRHIIRIADSYIDHTLGYTKVRGISEEEAEPGLYDDCEYDASAYVYEHVKREPVKKCKNFEEWCMYHEI